MLFVSLIYDLRNSEKNIRIKAFRLTYIITLVQQSSSKAPMHIGVKKIAGVSNISKRSSF